MLAGFIAAAHAVGVVLAVVVILGVGLLIAVAFNRAVPSVLNRLFRW